MAAVKLRLFRPKLLECYTVLGSNYHLNKSCYCTTKESGFASFFKKQVEYTQNLEQDKKPSKPSGEKFITLLRKSKFVDLGDPEGKIVLGTVYRVVEDDLYIDFGWKLSTVCPKPMKNPESYVKGTKVRLLIKDLELSGRFLGSTTDLTLNEADCVLLGALNQNFTEDNQ